MKGIITLMVNNQRIQELRYENKKQRTEIIDGWKLSNETWDLSEAPKLSYVIAPDPDVVDTTLGDIAKRFTWDFRPYRKPVFEEEQWERPKAVYSNRNHSY